MGHMVPFVLTETHGLIQRQLLFARNLDSQNLVSNINHSEYHLRFSIVGVTLAWEDFPTNIYSRNLKGKGKVPSP